MRNQRGDGWLQLRTGILVLGCIVALYGFSAKDVVARPGQANQSPDALHQLSSSVEQLVSRVSPSVVQVRVTGFGTTEEGDSSETALVIGRFRSIGSGVIVDPEGYILTNAHVLKGAQRVEVLLPSSLAGKSPDLSTLLSSQGRTMDARIVGQSKEIDLAVLKIEAKNLPALPIGKYSDLRQGEMVLAFGSPGGLQNSVTMGVISAVARQPDPDSPMVYIQTDAPINPGNSGGPLVNVDGEIVGINTFILTQSGGNEGLGFAIPSGVVAVAYPQLLKYGHLHRGEIGIRVQTITPNLAAGLGLPTNQGVIVSDVVPGSPAEQAGLKIQDIILSMNDKPIGSLPIFGLNMLMLHKGDVAKIRFLRGSEKMQVEVPVAQRPHNVDLLAGLVDPEKNLVSKLGILGIEINARSLQLLPNVREASGVIVAAKVARLGAEENSLAVGDVIHALNGMTVIGLDFLRSQLDAIKPDSPVVLQIERDGSMMYTTFRTD
jgi:serine protease Do